MVTGLDGVGKSSILTKMKLSEVTQLDDLEFSKNKHINMTCLQKDSAELRYQISESAALVFVIDASDRESVA